METYIIVHESEYGVDLYRLQCDEMLFVERCIESEEVQRQVAEHLMIDWNPLKDTMTVYSDQSVTENPSPLVLDMEF
jgi:hypothetical protein